MEINQQEIDAVAIRITSEYETQQRQGTGFDPNRLAFAAIKAYLASTEREITSDGLRLKIEGVKSKLIKYAAELVRGDNLTSPYQDDHKKKAPAWLLSEIHDDRENMAHVGRELKKCFDALAQVTKALSQIEGGRT